MKTLLGLILALSWASPAFAESPDVQLACKQAVNHAGLDGALDSWSARARLRNLIPDVDAEVVGYSQRTFGDNYREALTPLNGDLTQKTLQTTTDDDTQARFGFRVRASISLGGLIYDNNEARSEVLARDRAQERELICARVIEFYFQWWEARRALQLPNQDPESPANVEEARARAHLDALTAGWFSLQLRKSK